MVCGCFVERSLPDLKVDVGTLSLVSFTLAGMTLV